MKRFHPIVDRRYDRMLDKLGELRESAMQRQFGEEFAREKDAFLLASSMEVLQNEIRKTYLPLLSREYVPVEVKEKYSYPHRVRIFQVTKWVTDRTEDLLDKLSNVYSALSGLDCSVALVFRRKQKETRVCFVIANQSDESIDPAVADSLGGMFLSALSGNFPGAECREILPEYGDLRDGSSPSPLPEAVAGEWFAEENSRAVAMITNIASESSEKFVSQGIEKLLDGVVPRTRAEEYTLLLLAQPMTDTEIGAEKQRLSEIYTEFSPFAEVQTSMSISEAYSRTKNISTSRSLNAGFGGSSGLATATATTGTVSAGTGVKIGKIWQASVNFAVSTMRSVAKSLAGQANVGVGAQNSYGLADTSTTTKGETVSSTRTNYRVKEALEITETHIRRLQQGEARGMWQFAAYVLAGSYAAAQNVSNMYRSLTEGDDSFQETESINLWNAFRKEQCVSAARIRRCLRQFTHPRFILRDLEEAGGSAQPDETPPPGPDVMVLPPEAAGFTAVTGKELAMAMNLPRAAVSGLPVIECAAFGRDVIAQGGALTDGTGRYIDLGSIFHMQKKEEKRVRLDPATLPEHCFVTGSTGAGKTTTITRLLREASALRTPEGRPVRFLVVEPAKGEYRRRIGALSGGEPVFVFGTNPKDSSAGLLRIDPFAFPTDEIHILEHLDRLIEILSVCWPLYAAMPAVLKKGVEEAYEACGWDLLDSVNRSGFDIFPTFADVCSRIRAVIDRSDYSADNRSDYKGALVTRLESLTNGVNGLIFCSDPVPESVLFEQNAVVDLSRVGSAETKALIMGVLVMKLQEYRMALGGSDRPLCHVTVLEEAHNLLRRTSLEQHADSGNLQGKSVEMLANSIAEMRTYGEAFVIADQAPGLLDMSVIRNTNTKIIMRLPDLSDRELVGRAADLNDDQIVEIAKLRQGVAAVYYNGWISPVLCCVDRVETAADEATAARIPAWPGDPRAEALSEALRLFVHRIVPADLNKFLHTLSLARLPGEFRRRTVVFCRETSAERRDAMLPALFYELLDPARAIRDASAEKKPEQANSRLQRELGLDAVFFLTKTDRETILLNLLTEHVRRTDSEKTLLSDFDAYFSKKHNM